MAQSSSYDAVIVGSGPNGLAAAITLARAGRSVLVIEGGATLGGGMRTQEITLPGFRHDICSAIHPLGLGSPFFRSLPLDQFGLAWVQPEIPLAHPLDDGTAMALHRSIEQTAASIGGDGQAWAALMGPLAQAWPRLAPALLGPLPLSPDLLALTRFGLNALPSARWLAERRFQNERARALFAGLAAHSFLPLDQMLTASFGLVLGILAHAVGWPAAHGGSQSIADAMARYLQLLGGDIVCGWTVDSLDELPPAKAVLLDVTPRQLLALAGDRLPGGYARRLANYRYGPGVFKIDYALSGPVPWTAAECRAAGTVHLGGTLDEIALSERQTTLGIHPDRPYVLIAQQSLFDADACARRKADALGLLSRAQWLGFGYDGADRGADRALCAWIPRPDPGQIDADCNGNEPLQPQLHRRRHQRRRPGSAPALDTAAAALAALCHAAEGCLSLLIVDAAGRRRPWDVWGSRRAGGVGERAAVRLYCGIYAAIARYGINAVLQRQTIFPELRHPLKTHHPLDRGLGLVGKHSGIVAFFGLDGHDRDEFGVDRAGAAEQTPA